MASNAQRLDELTQTAEQHHEQYLRSLRSLHDGLGLRRRERADSRTTNPEPFTPPLRALSGPTFGTDCATGRHILRRTRRSTLEGAEQPSSIPEAAGNLGHTPNPNDGVFHHDDDFSFIPLLDLAAATTAAPVAGTVQRTLTPMRFADDRLLRHLRSTDFSDEMARVLDEVVKRRADIDTAVPFRDFAAFEREGYVSSTFEVYEIGKNATATKLSADLDGEGVVKYTGDVPFESPDGIVDAPTVWEAIKDINSDGQSVGRITLV